MVRKTVKQTECKFFLLLRNLSKKDWCSGRVTSFLVGIIVAGVLGCLYILEELHSCCGSESFFLLPKLLMWSWSLRHGQEFLLVSFLYCCSLVTEVARLRAGSSTYGRGEVFALCTALVD